MGGHFDIPNKNDEIKKLEGVVSSPNFWDDVEKANETNKKLASLKKISKMKECFYLK